MPARTTAADVKLILGDDYAEGRNITPFVTGANILTTRLVALAAEEGAAAVPAATLKEIEGWLAAHLYTRSDRVYSSRSTKDASGAFVAKGDEYLETAKMLDPTGLLPDVLSAQTATASWAGKAPSEQTDYADRD